MDYLKVKDIAEKWKVSERTVRNYCANGKIKGAKLIGKTWHLPLNSIKPNRLNSKPNLLDVLVYEKKKSKKGGIYHKVQIELTYNSNHIEGSKLSHDQTRYIYETNTLGGSGDILSVDDIIETANHFRCIDILIENANKKLTTSFIKRLHLTLKNGTSDSRKDWFSVGEYKKLPNQVGGKDTTPPERVEAELKELILQYNKLDHKGIDELLDFHYRFEKIHPFQDGNGRVGRLILFKECLKNNIVPFIISEELKMFYYRGLDQKGYLRDTCLTAQDKFKEYLDYFRINY